MHVMGSPAARFGKRKIRAFTLVETVLAIMIVALVLGGMTVAYTQATRRAQWAGYQLAAQALAVQSLEQARAAVWDQTSGVAKNQITNLNLAGTSFSAGGVTGYSWTNLDLPVNGTNVVRATNYVAVSMIYLNGTNVPPVQIQMVKVQTVWPFLWGNVNRFYTNTISTYYAPDNRDATTL